MTNELFKTSFNIKDVINEKTQKNETVITKDIYDKAEKIVKDKVVNQKGSEIESRKYNEILAKCILGDSKSVSQMYAFIEQYLKDSKKFSDNEISLLVNPIYVNNFGLSAIDDLVQDDSINEIWVNGYNHIWIEKGGIKQRLNKKFRSDEEVIRVMRQMLQFDRKEITKAAPTAESKLLDGSRITFAIPPASSKPCINIRKFKAFDVNEKNILGNKTISKEQLNFLKAIVEGRANLLVIGETGSGKTSFLKFLCDYINPNLRLGTIESNFELKLSEKYPDRNIFEYESHEELGLTLGELFKLCLRSSPDIIILGEARGSEEAEALINSMRRGHPGSIGTIHTNGPDTAIDDLMEMIMEDGKKREPSLLKHRISNAVEFIVQAHRLENGDRKIIKITEVIPILDDESYGRYELNDIWVYNKKQNEFNMVSKIKNKKLIKKLAFHGVSEEDLLKYSEY